MESDSRKVIVAVVLVIILTLTVVVVVLDDLGGPFDDTCGYVGTGNLVLEHSGTDSREVDGDRYWDVWFVCTDIVPNGTGPPWISMSYGIEAYEDGYSNGFLNPYLGSPLNSTQPVALFEDVVGDPQLLDVGDSICLSGLNRSHQGMAFTLSSYGTMRSFLYDWTDLPQWDETVAIGIRHLDTIIPRKGSDIWDVRFVVETVDPEWETVPWSQVAIRTGPTSRYDRHDYHYRAFSPLSDPPYRHRTEMRGFYADRGDDTVEEGDIVVVTGPWSEHLGYHILPLVTGNVTVGYLDVHHLPDTSVTIEFSGPNLVRRDLPDNMTVWDCEFEIVLLLPTEGYLSWGNPRVAFDSNRSIHDITWLAVPERVEYPNTTVVQFRESEPVDGNVEVGDVVVIRRLTKDFEGLTLVMQMYHATVRLELPSSFE